MEKMLYNASDIAADLSISEDEAGKLLDKMRERMEQCGYITIRGFISRIYYEKQKERGFMDDVPEKPDRVPLNEKRLLSIEEFCEYAGGIGICTARKYARKIGVEMRIGGRCLVDREKFDRWCDSNNAAD